MEPATMPTTTPTPTPAERPGPYGFTDVYDASGTTTRGALLRAGSGGVCVFFGDSMSAGAFVNLPWRGGRPRTYATRKNADRAILRWMTEGVAPQAVR